MLSNWYGRSVLIALVVIVAGAFGSTYYYAYQRGLEDGRVSLPPVILADRAPLKVMNTDKPKIATRHIDNVASGKALLETSPADNATGAVESLLDKKPEAKIEPLKDVSKLQIQAPKKTAPKPPTKTEIKKEQRYMVQLLAARNSTQALSSYRRLQTKHKDLLTGREPLITRIDLGEKGVYHRVNVSGFADKAAATKFCNALKKQKQNCLVRKQS